jgi:hypothetical protein
MQCNNGRFTHSMSCPCRAAPLPCSDSAVSFVKVRVVAGNIRTASPNSLTDRLFFCSVLLPLFFLVRDKRYFVSHWSPASEIGMLLITNFVELRVVAGSSRTLAGNPQAVSRLDVLYRGLEKNSMVRAWHGHGMASVNQTRPHCVNQMGKTHSKPLAARHGHGMLFVNRP